MLEFILFIVIAAVIYQLYIRKGMAMAPRMGELAERGIDIDAQVVKKSRIQSNFGRFHYHLVYSFTIGNNQNFSREVSMSFELWDSLEEGDKLPVVYLAEDPNVSTTKDMADQIRAAMPQKDPVHPDGGAH